tara:strand:+ start:19602 stop:21074 length:1473 start_codon:yes stop_codon:yes gene_type:complete
VPSIPFIKGDRADNNTDYRDSLPVNYYAVLRNIYGEQGYMLNYYGLSDFAQGEGVSRGSVWVAREGIDGVVSVRDPLTGEVVSTSTSFEGQYRVSGTSLLRIRDDGSVIIIGDVGGTGQVSFAYSLLNLVVVSSGRLFYYNPDDGFREITGDAVGNPIDIVWADFRFILTDGEYLYQSSELDETFYSLLAYQGSDFQPDKILGVGLNDDNELIAFNENTVDTLVNVGAENFTYQRITGKAVKSGIAGTHAKAEYKDQWFALTRRINTQYQFAIIQLGSAESITTREIEKVLTKYNSDELSTTVIEVFTKDGVTWMIAHLPNETLAYNDTVARKFGIDVAWSVISTGLECGNYRGKDMTYDPRFSKWCIGDKLDGRIGFLDDAACTHYGELVSGLLYTPVIGDAATLSINTLTIETIPGISPDNDATIFISRSENLRTFGKEWMDEYGLNLEYGKNLEVRNLGYIRTSVSFKIRTASRSRMSFCRFNMEAT